MRWGIPPTGNSPFGRPVRSPLRSAILTFSGQSCAPMRKHVWVLTGPVFAANHP